MVNASQCKPPCRWEVAFTYCLGHLEPVMSGIDPGFLNTKLEWWVPGSFKSPPDPQIYDLNN